MKYEEASALRESWGSKRCTHPAFEDEYLFDSRTGDSVCVQCGKIMAHRLNAGFSRQGHSMQIVKFDQQSVILKESMLKLARHKDDLADLDIGEPRHVLLDALLQDQRTLIERTDELLAEINYNASLKK